MNASRERASCMENRFDAPASGTPEERSARREFELLLLLGGSRKAAVQLWLRKQRIYANAQQAAGRPATEAKGSRGAAERQAGGESKPETAAQAARRHRSEHRLREKHLARKIWAAVRVRKHLSRWCERARAAVAKRPASSSTTSTAAAAPPPAPPPPPPAPDQAQARATPPAGAAAAASSAPDIFMMEGPQEGELPLHSDAFMCFILAWSDMALWSGLPRLAEDVSTPGFRAVGGNLSQT